MNKLQIENIYFEPANLKILENISFQIEEVQHTSLNGPSGSGKSTLLKIIASLIRPTDGMIYLNDKPQSEYNLEDYRQKVSYVHQTPQLFGNTIADNLALPFEIHKQPFDAEKSKGLMAALGLDYLDLNQAIQHLSGGERQRVALIRHLLFPPQFLLLDEITSGLDEATRDILWDFLFEFAEKENVTLIWISHNADEQDLAKQKINLSIEGVMRSDSEQLMEVI